MSLRPNSRTEVRKKSYETGVDGDEARRRREDNLVEIRKNKREDNLLKKRREGLLLQSQQLSDASQTPAAIEKRLESIPLMVQGVWSEDPAAQIEATTQFRKLLSIERSPPIDEVIKAGVVPRFVEFLGRQDLPQLQFEAAWALTNVASGTSEHTQVVIEHGAVPKFVLLLSSASDDVREQVKPALPVLRQLIHLNDEEVLTDACWALSYLSDGPNDKIQAVIEAGVCPRLVELLLHPSPTVLIPALRTVGNIVTGDDTQTQFVIENHVLPCLYQLLTQNHKKSIKKEACWTISNITAGNRSQIQAVIEANIILPLVHLLQHAEFDIKKEAAWAISNATSGGSHDQIRSDFDCGRRLFRIGSDWESEKDHPREKDSRVFDRVDSNIVEHSNLCYVSRYNPLLTGLIASYICNWVLGLVVASIYLYLASVSILGFVISIVEDDCFRSEAIGKARRINELMQENQLYRRVFAYLNSLSSIEDTDFANLFAGNKSNEINLFIDPNEIVVDIFLSARVY
ncbi:Importin subunit alpha-4 [Camellia lanceoleosa]|uniref:Importin subunit alpha-4 n=1 Tax=Camellia lanceoleosa TaxID=1840588 RepID=A0ACC0IG47_9ERIC|nr:Importin subunit alpha-4 [Camellia lanceoleosa]